MTAGGAVDLLSVSGGTGYTVRSSSVFVPGDELPENVNGPHAGRLRRATGVATLVAGRILDADTAEQALTRDGQYEPALAVVDTFAPLLKDAAAAARIAAPVYDRWSQHLAAKREWQAAADVYEQALRRFPRDPHLENNAAVTWDQWARTFIDRKDWPAAIEVYDRALARLPGNALLDRNRRYCEERQRQRG